MAGMLIITAPGGSLGFRCAGLECREVDADVDVSALLLGLHKEGRYALLAMEQGLIDRASESVLKRLVRAGLPVIVPLDIPTEWDAVAPGESPVVKLIRKAIGYQIKIKR